MEVGQVSYNYNRGQDDAGLPGTYYFDRVQSILCASRSYFVALWVVCTGVAKRDA